jgi:hypothetical protein
MKIIKEIPKPIKIHFYKPQVFDSSRFILLPQSIIKLITSSGSKGSSLSCGPFYASKKKKVHFFFLSFFLFGENDMPIFSPISQKIQCINALLSGKSFTIPIESSILILKRFSSTCFIRNAL